MKKFKSHEITVKGTLGVTAINVKTVEDVEKAVQQIAPANYSEVSTKDGEYGIIEIHKTENGEYRYILTYNGENPYDATILDEYNKIIGYVQITDEEIDEVAENYKKAQKKVEVIGGRFYTKKDVVKSRKVNCTLGRSVYKDVHFTERVEISKEEAEEILKNYGFTAESYIAYKNGDRTEENAKAEASAFEIEVSEESTPAKMTVTVLGSSTKELMQKLMANIATLSSIYTAADDTYEVFDVNTKATVQIKGSEEETATSLDEAYKKATAFFIVEDDGSNDDPDEDFLATIDTSIDDDNDEIQALLNTEKAEVESTEVVKDDGKDFLDLLESETADSAVEKTVEEEIECKPKLADKPYTCVTKRVGDFFNPKKFFSTLNDAVRYALVDKSKRMDWDERYNGAAVCLVYENGRCRPIWEITAEGKFEMVDASEDYGELDNDAVKAELANIDTAQSVNIEKDIVETLNEIKYCNQDIERAKSRMENAKYWGKTEDVSIAEKDLLKEEKAKAKELSKLAEFSTNYPKIYAKAIKVEKEKYGAYFNRTYSGIATIES